MSFNPLRVDVPGSGNPFGTYAFIGEAPGSTEMATRVPFTGIAGGQFDRLLSVIPITKSDSYITNVCKTQLPKNDSAQLHKGSWRHPDWPELQKRLFDELAQTSARVLIPMGETAIAAFSDYISPKPVKISTHRGSVYDCGELGLHQLAGKYLMPTWHPAKFLPSRDPAEFWTSICDLRKAKRIIEQGLNVPALNLMIRPTFSQACEYLQAIIRDKPRTAVDIETFRSPAVPGGDRLKIFTTCIAFAPRPWEAMSIPLTGSGPFYWPESMEFELIRLIARILEDRDIPIIGQNFQYDATVLYHEFGIRTKNLAFDTMLAQHLCWTDLSKSLQYLCSIYTDYPFYKAESQEAKITSDLDKYWLYNAKDAAITRYLADRLQPELEAFHAEHTFKHIMELHAPLTYMTTKGVLVDQEELRVTRCRLENKVFGLESAVYKILGYEIGLNSPKQLCDLFYIQLGHQPYIDRKTKSITVNKRALILLGRSKNKKIRILARLIRKYRKYSKLVGTYYSMEFDEDGRERAQYKISGTETGRLSSAKTIYQTGTNDQNIPKPVRKVFKADPGCIFLEPDLSQAEARDVAYLAQEEAMIKGFESRVDIHRLNASNIFGIPMDQVTKEQRDLGKKTVHAANYSMGPQTFAEFADIDFSVAKRLLDAYHSRYPGLHRWHNSIKIELQNGRVLHNLFGRPKRFLGILDEPLFRSAFAYKPQSSVAETLNRGMLTVCKQLMTPDEEFMPVKTVHDSLLIMVRLTTPKRLFDIMLTTKCALEIEQEVYGRKFIIPCDFKLGYSWGALAEIKELTYENMLTALAQVHKDA